MDIIKQLEIHEGLRLYPYDDHDGKRVGRGHKNVWYGYLTIGIGINLETGISQEEAYVLTRMRVDRLRTKLRHCISFFDSLTINRQNVLIDMAYNMGISGLLKFKNMLAALESGDYDKAVYEMKNSLWATQVQADRVNRLTWMMRNG